jgi:hypothetical protein
MYYIGVLQQKYKGLVLKWVDQVNIWRAANQFENGLLDIGI